MSSVNRVILIGRLTRDPEMRFTPSGAAVATFTLAVDRNYTNAQGEREADFIRIVVWRKLAETVSNYLGKGRLVAVEGRLQVRSYQDQQGNNRTITEVVGENIQFLDRAREGTGAGGGPSTGFGGPPDAPDMGFPAGGLGDDFGSEEPPF